MINILHVVRPSAGGIRQHVIQLIKYLPAEVVTHSIAAPASFIDDLPSELNIEIYYPLDIGPSTSFRDIKTSIQLKQISRKKSNTLVHAHGIRSGFISALANVPYICTAHNLAKNGGFYGNAIRFIAKNALSIVAVSAAVRDSLYQCGVNERSVSIIPNGVDIKAFQNMPTNAGMALGVSKNDYIVGCIGRLSYEKGIDILVETAKSLPDVKFLIAGDGPERNKLMGSAPDNVRFLGRIIDTRELLAVADVLVIPSREEGQGIVALEALASHVPIIATSVGGLQTMLTHKQNAILVKPEDPGEIAESIKLLRKAPSLHEILTQNGYEMVLQNYDVHVTSQLVLRHYEQVYNANFSN